MARVQLSAGDSIGVSGNFDIYGTAEGVEKVTILASTGTYKFDASFNRGGDNIELPGSIFSWRVMRSGSTAILSKEGISVTVPVGVIGATITFADAITSLRMDLAANQMYLGLTPFQFTSVPALPFGNAPKLQLAEKVYTDEGVSGAFRAIAIDDDQNSIITYSLPTTSHNQYFTIDQYTGAVSFRSPAAYQSDKATYVVSVQAIDQTGLKSSQDVLVVVKDRSDNAPAFAARTAAISVQEGQYLTGYKAAATQADSRDFIRYSISGGADAERFEVDLLTGQLAFKGRPTDYEKPAAAGGGNLYEVIVSAVDLAGHSTSQTVIVTVTDKSDENSGNISITSAAMGTMLASSVSLSCIENQMATGYVGINQILSAGSYRFEIGGADAARFWINPATGALFFRNGGADFEARNSAAGTNNYQVNVIVTDGVGNQSLQAVTIKIANQVYETTYQKGGALINSTGDGGITFYGDGADNLVIGTERFDDLTGWFGNDYIRGLGGNDYLRGDPGDDKLEGGAGDDRLMGNEGIDTAVYIGFSFEAQIRQEAPGSFTVVTPSEGRDSLPFGDMEFVSFPNAVIALNGDLATGASFWTNSSKSALVGSRASDIFKLSNGNVVVDGREGDDVAYLEGDFTAVLEKINATSWSVTFGIDSYVLTNVEVLAVNNISYNLSINSQNVQISVPDKSLYGTNKIDIFVLYSERSSITGPEDYDKAIVLVDNYKTTSQVSVWEYASDVVALPYWINALLPNGAASFAGRLSDKIVYYTFPDVAPSYLNGSELAEFSKFNENQRAYVRSLLTYISTVVNLKFVETADANRAGTITFFNTNAAPNLGGYARYPDADPPFDMDNVVNITSEESAAIQHKAPAKDNWGGASLIHEVGHSLGLKHPFTSQGDEPGYLPVEEAIKTYSVMAYDGWVVTPTSWQFAELDLAALQYLYGPSRATNNGDNIYKISTQTNNFIWDGGGVDTIDLSDCTEGGTVSLVPGFHGFIGEFSPLITAPGQVTINFGSVIENIIGSHAGDRLFGNEFKNKINGGAGDDWLDGGLGDDDLTGGLGNDVIFGGLGFDTAYFSGNRADYTIIMSGSQVIVTSAIDGRDILCDIEQLAFRDQIVALSAITSGIILG